MLEKFIVLCYYIPEGDNTMILLICAICSLKNRSKKCYDEFLNSAEPNFEKRIKKEDRLSSFCIFVIMSVGILSLYCLVATIMSVTYESAGVIILLVCLTTLTIADVVLYIVLYNKCCNWQNLLEKEQSAISSKQFFNMLMAEESFMWAQEEEKSKDYKCKYCGAIYDLKKSYTCPTCGAKREE